MAVPRPLAEMLLRSGRNPVPPRIVKELAVAAFVGVKEGVHIRPSAGELHGHNNQYARRYD